MRSVSECAGCCESECVGYSEGAVCSESECAWYSESEYSGTVRMQCAVSAQGTMIVGAVAQ